MMCINLSSQQVCIFTLRNFFLLEENSGNLLLCCMNLNYRTDKISYLLILLQKAAASRSTIHSFFPSWQQIRWINLFNSWQVKFCQIRLWSLVLHWQLNFVGIVNGSLKQWRLFLICFSNISNLEYLHRWWLQFRYSLRNVCNRIKKDLATYISHPHETVK